MKGIWILSESDLMKFNTDGLTMTDKSLEEFLFKQGFHPMPFVRYTERA